MGAATAHTGTWRWPCHGGWSSRAPPAMGRGSTDRSPRWGCCHGCSVPPVEPPARRPILPSSHRDGTSEAQLGAEKRGRSFKHCQVSTTGGKQVQRQQELLKVFDIVPGGLPNACKCFKGGSPFCGHGNVSQEPQSVQCFKDHCSLKIPTQTTPPAENLPKQIPSWLTTAEELCSATEPSYRPQHQLKQNISRFPPLGMAPACSLPGDAVKDPMCLCVCAQDMKGWSAAG